MGYVVYRKGGEVVTDFGRSNGARRGNTLVVFKIDSAVRHPVTDDLIRVWLIPIGIIRLEEVGEISSSGKIVSAEDKIEVGQFVRIIPMKRIPVEGWWEEGIWWKNKPSNRITEKSSSLFPDKPLLTESFDENNGVKGEAYSGEYSHSKDAKPSIIPLDEIGLVGSPEYTIEFYWLPEKPKMTPVNAILFTNISSNGPALRCIVGPETHEWHNMVFEVNDYPIRLDGYKTMHWSPGKWHHIILTGNLITGMHFLYINSVQKRIQTRGYSDNGWKNPEIAFLTETGRIDDIAIYNKQFVKKTP